MKTTLLTCILIILAFKASAQVLQFTHNSDKAFTISTMGDAWYSNWLSESGISELGAVLRYDINPSFIYNVKLNLEVPFVSLELNRSSSTVGKRGFDAGVNDVAKYLNYYGYLHKRIFGTQALQLNMMYATFGGNLLVNDGGVFGIGQNELFTMDSKWLKYDVLYLAADNDRAAVGLGYRYIKYNKPQAFATFYGTPGYVGDLNSVTADELISASIEDTELTGKYFIMYYQLKRNQLQKGVYGDFMFGIGEANVQGQTHSINGKIGAFMDFFLGYGFNFKIRNFAAFNLDLGYKYMYNKITVADDLGEDREGHKYIGTYSSETWHGPVVSGGFAFTLR